MVRFLLLTSALIGASAYHAVVPQRSAAAVQSRRAATSDVRMINLFGNNDESKQRRNDLSLRDAPVGSNKVAFRKPNQATDGLVLGLKFREDWSKAVFIDKIVPGTEAASLQARGKINEGDEVTMVSATFGDEMWSARGIGKYRLEKSIAVRQGATIAFVFENKKKDRPNQAQIQKEKDRMSRMQQQLAKEVDANKSKKQGGLFGGLFD